VAFPAWRLLVQTPEAVLLDLPGVEWVEVQLVDSGPLRILRGHTPLVAEVAVGALLYGTPSGEHGLRLDGGLVSITRGQVTVFTTGGQATADVVRSRDDGFADAR
jgi:F0F1-type ATP synthase epsilon subunit